MEEKELIDWINRPKNKRILETFSIPKTPAQVQEELKIKKFNLKPFLKRGLVRCLNPEASKGRLYVLTEVYQSILRIPNYEKCSKKDYGLIGWIMASPRQRFVVLKVIARDSVKRFSEDIRKRAASLNPCLSRISTKAVLKELMDMDLVDSEMGMDRKRYYWLTEKGRSIAGELH